MQIKTVLAVLSMFISCLSLQAQRDSIINKTWVATMGDIFRFSSDSTKPGGVAFRLNYDQHHPDYLKGKLGDSTFTVISFHDYGRNLDHLYWYKYNYQRDSIILEKLPDYNFAFIKNGSASKIDESRPYLPKYKTRMVFFDSTFYFKDIKHFKTLEINHYVKKIFFDSTGFIQVEYLNHPANYTSRLGLFKGKISKQEVEKVNKFLHLAQFELWEPVFAECSRRSRFVNYQITYSDTVYDKHYIDLEYDCKRLPVFEFANYLFRLTDTMQFTDTSNSYLFRTLPYPDSYKLVFGKPILIGEYKVLRKRNRYLYEIRPDSFHLPSDSIHIGYFSTDTLVDTSRTMAFALQPVKKITDKTIIEEYYGLLETYWAPHENWSFLPGEGSVKIYPRPMGRVKRFLLFRVRLNPYRKMDKLLKKHRRKNTTAAPSDELQ